MKKSEIIFGIARIPIDFGMTIAAFLVAYYIRLHSDLIPGLYFPVDVLHFPSIYEYLKISLLASLALMGVFAINRMYSLTNTVRIGNEIINVIFLTSAWIMLIIGYYFVTRELFFSRLVLGYVWILTLLFVSFGRIWIRLLQRYLCRFNIGRRRILLVGTNKMTERILKKLKKFPSYHVIGCVSVDEKPSPETKLKILGCLQELTEIIKKYRIEEIIQVEHKGSELQAEDLVEFCRQYHIGYHFVPDILQVHRSQIDVFNIAQVPLISLKTTPLEGWGKVLKRLFDGVGSLLLLGALSPLLLAIAIGIKLDSKGPILFTQKDDGSSVKRVGRRGELFTFFKFRSMKEKTDNLRYTMLAQYNHRQGSPLVKIKNDPRVTRFGQFLRRWSLDELPQLWNVLRGDMSLVGPRAHLPEEVEHYEKHHQFLLSIKPGITGLAQVNGRSDLDFEKECRLDTYYIENWSILLDLKILFRTIFVVLGGKGAD